MSLEYLKVIDMTFKEYQDQANATAAFPDLIIRPDTNNSEYENIVASVKEAESLSFLYPALGLAGESGEALEKIKKILRDDNGVVTDEKREAIKKELGDVIWYWATLCTEFGFDCEEVAQGNLDKLYDRRSRNVIHGSGDNR